MSFSRKTRRQRGRRRRQRRVLKHTCSALRGSFHQRRDAIAKEASVCRASAFPFRSWTVRPETPPASLAAASLYLVSRVWKTLNGFLMTWNRPATVAGGRREADTRGSEKRATADAPSSFFRLRRATDGDGDYRLVKEERPRFERFTLDFECRCESCDAVAFACKPVNFWLNRRLNESFST